MTQVSSGHSYEGNDPSLGGLDRLIRETAQRLQSVGEDYGVYAEFARLIKKLVDFDWLAVNIPSEDGHFFTIQYQEGEGALERDTANVRPLQGSLTHHVLTTRQTVVRPDIASGQKFPTDEAHLKAGLCSAIMTPLLSQGKAVGTLSLRSKKVNAFGSRERAILEVLARQIAPEVENAALYQKLDRYAREMDLVDEVARIITSTDDIGQVFDKFALGLKKLVDFDRANIYLIDREAGTIVNKYLSGGQRPGNSPGSVRPLAGTQVEYVMRTGQTLVRDIPSDPSFPIDNVYLEEGLRCAITVPLEPSLGRVIGTIGLCSRKQDTYGLREQVILERVARQIAPAIESAQVYQRLQATREETELADEVARIVISTLNIDQVYDKFAEEVKKLVDFDRVAINAIDPHTKTYTFKYSAGLTHPRRPVGTTEVMAGTMTEMVMNTCCTLVRPNLSAGPPFPWDENLVEMGLSSLIMVPMVVKGTVIGTLTFSSKRANSYGLREQQILERLARQIAPAVENARLYEEARREQELLATTLARLKALVEGVDAGVLMVEKDNQTVLWANLRFGELFGVSAEELESVNRGSGKLAVLRQQASQCLKDPEPFFAEVDRIYQDTSYTGKLEDVELIFPCYRIISRFTSPVYDQDGEYLGRLWVYNDVTENRQAHQAVRDSEERLRTLLEKLPECVVVVVDGKIMYANPALSAACGYSQEEMLGRSPLDFVHPEDRSRAAERVKGLLAGAPEAPSEYRVIRKDGTLDYVEAYSRLVDYGGQRALLSVLRYLTEQKEAEKALRESEERFRTFFQSAPVGIASVNVEGRILQTNRAFCEMLGYAEDELVGRTIMEVTHPDDLEISLAHVNEIVAGHKSHFKLQKRYIRKDGGVLWGEVSVSVVQDASGGFRYSFAMIEDITERKQADEELRKLMRAVEQSPNSVMITDTEGRIEYVNPKFSQLTGYAMEELIGQTPSILKSGMVSQEDYKRLWDTISQGNEWRGEVLNRKKDGETYWSSESISPIRNPEGQITHYVAVEEDITERKQLEEQLLQSRKMETVGRLAGGVAHDFNNLLTAIIGYTQMALRTSSSPGDVKYYLQEAHKAAERAANLTGQLLAFSRRQVIEARAIDLNELILNLDRMLRRLIGEDIELVTLPNPELRPVKVDTGQVEQVLMNLAVNARDAMPMGGKLVIATDNVSLTTEDVRWLSDLSPGEYVLLTVSDTGVGMTKEVIDHVFEPFFTTKEVGEGSGLGLSTCYGIVAQSGGCIEVESEPGQGTTFKIYLPVTDEPVQNVDRYSSPGYLPRGAETVLLAEDEPSVRAMVAHLLREQGYHVLEASNGGEAVWIAQEQQGKDIHILVSDVVMPHMSGQELAERIRAMYPNIKVLFTSGYTEGTMLQLETLPEGTDFLQKPYMPDTLVVRVREALDQ